jgi:hypothetical protein
MRPEALRHPGGAQAAAAPAGMAPGQVSQQWQAALERERQPSADGAAAAVAAGVAVQAATDPPAGAVGAGRLAAPALQPRVGWRDASASATWLAPVRPRAPSDASAGSTGAAVRAAEAPAAGVGAGGTAGAAAASAGRVPAGQVMQSAATLDVGQGEAGFVGRDVSAPEPMRSAGSGQAIVPFGATTAAVPVPGNRVTAAEEARLPAQAEAALPPRSALQGDTPGLASSLLRPARPGAAFAPTHLHIGPGEDGPALWLRDAAGGTDAATAQRLLQAMALLGWPREWRPAAMYLNGRPVWLATPAPLPAAALPAPPAPESETGSAPTPHHFIKEEPHGH